MMTIIWLRHVSYDSQSISNSGMNLKNIWDLWTVSNEAFSGRVFYSHGVFFYRYRAIVIPAYLFHLLMHLGELKQQNL